MTLGITWAPLENSHLREYVGIDSCEVGDLDRSGVMVCKVDKTRHSDETLQRVCVCVCVCVYGVCVWVCMFVRERERETEREKEGGREREREGEREREKERKIRERERERDLGNVDRLGVMVCKVDKTRHSDET